MNDSKPPRFLRSTDGEFGTAPGAAINGRYLADEATVVAEMLALARLPAADRAAIHRDAVALVAAARSRRAGRTGIEAFLRNTTSARGRASSSCASPRRCCGFRTPIRRTG